MTAEVGDFDAGSFGEKSKSLRSIDAPKVDIATCESVIVCSASRISFDGAVSRIG